MAYKIKTPKKKGFKPYEIIDLGNKRIENITGAEEGVSPFELKKQGYEDGEWANHFYVWHVENGKEEFAVYKDNTKRTSPYSVIFEGALDFDGNKKELLKAYPEMKKYL